MYHYLYRITNLTNFRFYIGKHSSDVPFDPHYWGHGTLIKKAVKKYGKDNFHREVLAYCNSAEDALSCEALIVDEVFLKMYNGITYNIDVGGRADIRSDRTKRKISNTLSGVKKTKEHCKNISNGRKGYKMKDEQKQKLSIALMGENNPNYGKPRSEETKQKMRIARKKYLAKRTI